VKVRVLFTSLGLMLFVWMSGFAQGVPAPAQGSGSGSGPAFDSMGVKQYLLGPGDVLEIKFFQQPDLNTVANVEDNGTISLPFLAAPIQASCRSAREVGQDVTVAYQKFFKSPQISVRVTEMRSRQPIVVYGAVREPQRIQALRSVRLSEIVSFAGGTTERSNGTIQIIHTQAAICPAPGDAVDEFDPNGVPKLYLYKTSEIVTGNPEANPFVRPGDVVTALDALPIYITGSVTNPTGLYLTEGMTLQRALSMVGGPKREAKASAVTITRRDPATGKQTVIPVDYTLIKKNEKPDIQLMAYDIIDVPTASPFSKGRIVDTFTQGLMNGVGSLASGPMTYLPQRVLY
jgi:polysaccharide export outer membrane protein